MTDEIRTYLAGGKMQGGLVIIFIREWGIFGSFGNE